MTTQMLIKIRAARGERKGLTLIELILISSLLLILVVILTGAMTLSKSMSIDQRNRSMYQGNLKRAIDTASRDLREAYQGVELASDMSGGCSSEANVCIYGETKIVFKVLEGTDLNGPYYKQIQYNHLSDSHVLQRTETNHLGEVVSDVPVGRGIKSIKFVWSDTAPNVISIRFSADNNMQHSTDVYLRNK